MQTIEMYLSQKQNIFSGFFSAILECALDFKHFQKKLTLIAYVFPKLQTSKDALRYMSKSSRLRAPLDRRHGKRAEKVP